MTPCSTHINMVTAFHASAAIIYHFHLRYTPKVRYALHQKQHIRHSFLPQYCPLSFPARRNQYAYTNICPRLPSASMILTQLLMNNGDTASASRRYTDSLRRICHDIFDAIYARPPKRFLLIIYRQARGRSDEKQVVPAWAMPLILWRTRVS